MQFQKNDFAIPIVLMFHETKKMMNVINQSTTPHCSKPAFFVSLQAVNWIFECNFGAKIQIIWSFVKINFFWQNLDFWNNVIHLCVWSHSQHMKILFQPVRLNYKECKLPLKKLQKKNDLKMDTFTVLTFPCHWPKNFYVQSLEQLAYLSNKIGRDLSLSCFVNSWYFFDFKA